MDAIDLGVLQWFDELLVDWNDLQTRLETTLPPVPKYEAALGLLGKRTENIRFVVQHYTQALRMRTVARELGNWTWYLSATYALCQDWQVVMESIPWAKWGCFSALGDSVVEDAMRKAAVLVGCMGKLPEPSLQRALLVFARGEAKEAIALARSRGLIDVIGIVYFPGPCAPRPIP